MSQNTPDFRCPSQLASLVGLVISLTVSALIYLTYGHQLIESPGDRIPVFLTICLFVATTFEAVLDAIIRLFNVGPNVWTRPDQHRITRYQEREWDRQFLLRHQQLKRKHEQSEQNDTP